jgi:hypothetical protein
LLGETQLKWLAAHLDEPRRQGKPVIVMVHHQPQLPETQQEIAAPAAKPIKISGIMDTKELMDILVPRRQVKALVFGHTHAWSHQRHESGLHLVNLPAVAYVFRPEQPSAWTDCRLSDSGAKFTLHCLDKNHPKNGDIVSADWRS